MRVIDKFAEALNAAGVKAKIWHKPEAMKLRIYLDLPRQWLSAKEQKKGAVNVYFDYDADDQVEALDEFDWRDDLTMGSVLKCWFNCHRSRAFAAGRNAEIRDRLYDLLVEHGLYLARQVESDMSKKFIVGDDTSDGIEWPCDAESAEQALTDYIEEALGNPGAYHLDPHDSEYDPTAARTYTAFAYPADADPDDWSDHQEREFTFPEPHDPETCRICKAKGVSEVEENY